jgi:protease-4
MVDEVQARKRRRRRRILFLLPVLIVGGLLARRFFTGPTVPNDSYVLLDLEGDYPERVPEDLLGRFIFERPPSLLDLLVMIRDAGDDRRIAGIVVRLRALSIGWAKTQELRDALAAFRAKNKRVYAYLEHEVLGSSLEYYLASVADKIYLPDGATAPLNGLLAHYIFLGGVWEKLDIEMHVEKIREYKTFGDMIANKEMSPYHREMANSLLDSVFGQLVSGVAEARKLSPDAVRQAIDASPATAAELADHGLADGAKFLEDLRVELAGAKGKLLEADDYRRAGGAPITAQLNKKIAVIYGVGTITTGESHDAALGSSMGSETIEQAFRDAAEDDGIASIVFRIDSPGGSALASDTVWRAVRAARAGKPVVASMSDVAGSGGYYIAVGASRVLAEPATFTGSIGVVMSKPNIRGFLAKLGVNSESLRRGEKAGMTSIDDPLTAGEQERLVSTMHHVYDLFVKRVAEGRKLSPEKVDEIGRGRVWTGEQARERGLVDDLGGFFQAVDAAKSAAGIPLTERVKLVFLPRQKLLIERVGELLDSKLARMAPEWIRSLAETLGAYDFAPGSILTLMPESIEIR